MQVRQECKGRIEVDRVIGLVDLRMKGYSKTYIRPGKERK